MFEKMASEKGGTVRARNGSPTFYNMLQEMAQTHDIKSHDYASNSNPYGNYEFAGEVALLFKHSPDDAGFASRLAEKIYRLSNLEGTGKSPQNESVADTERDIAVIATLWMAQRRDSRRNQSPMPGEAYKINPPTQAESMDAAQQIIKLATKLSLSDMVQLAAYLSRFARDLEQADSLIDKGRISTGHRRSESPSPKQPG